MENFLSRFESFEMEHSLFDLRIDNVPIWELLRFDVFQEINHQNGIGEAHSEAGEEWIDYVHGAKLFIENLIINNPFLAGESDILYIGHQRRKKRKDGSWWDIYCDPIHEKCDYNYIHLEKPHLLNHLQPAQTSNLRYIELINYGARIQSLLGINKPSITDTEQNKLEVAEIAIQERFNADVDLVSMALNQLHSRRTRLPLYKKLLKRINPKVAVVVVSYGWEVFIEACKQHNIPVVELQHGVIHDHHLGYSYPGPRTKETFPNYLLTFGDFWKDSVEYPIPDNNVISVGYPYLEKTIKQYNDVDTKDQLLFISQGTIGEELSRFAIEVEDCPAIDHNIVYKLHPGEYDRWKSEYPWLLEADFEIVDSADRQLYKLFAESSAQVGVGSTAVFEGLAFGLETYVYECSGSAALQTLVDEGSARLVSDVEQLQTLLGDGNNPFNREYYFSPKPTENVCEILRALCNSGISCEP